MHRFHSVRYKLMFSTFLIILVCSLALIYLGSQQLEDQFVHYLQMPGSMGMGRMMGRGMGNHHLTMGTAELDFLASYHKSLLAAGLGFSLLGLVASFFLAGTVTSPLRRLSRAAQEIRQGNLKQEVPVETEDEVGQLTRVFNDMSSELAATENNRREFLANVAHELRTPLAILQGQLENMLSGVEQPDPEKLFSMQEEVMRLTRMVAELRDLSLAQVNQLELHRQPVQVNELLSRAADMIQPLLEEKQLTIQKNLAKDVPILQLDPDRLNQVIYNLLNNAIRYTKEGTAITLQSAVKGDQVVITVADQGPGISPEDLPHIFEQFYRSDKARARASGGSGIGLALAKSFVENQGGTLTAENRPEGGAAFVITFPGT